MLFTVNSLTIADQMLATDPFQRYFINVESDSFCISKYFANDSFFCQLASSLVCFFFSVSVASSFNADGLGFDPSNCPRTSFWSTAIRKRFWKTTQLALDESKRSTSAEKLDKETGVQSELSFDILVSN